MPATSLLQILPPEGKHFKSAHLNILFQVDHKLNRLSDRVDAEANRRVVLLSVERGQLKVIVFAFNRQ